LSKRSSRRSIGVFADLVKAIDWYDVSLQSILQSRDLISVNRTQSVMLIHIAEGITRPSDISYEMGTTRQNIHAMAKPLIEVGFLEMVPDPEDGRSKQYSFCRESQAQRDAVFQVLKYLDRKLAERLGKDAFKQLKHALSQDWGEFISSDR